MASVTAPPVSATARARAGRLPAPVAFYLLVSISVFFLAGSSAPTPLYAVYQAAWGFSPLTTTIVFGVYALAVLAALLTVGSLSDYVGRRPVLLVAIDLQRHGDHHEKAQPNRHAPITPGGQPPCRPHVAAARLPGPPHVCFAATDVINTSDDMP